MKRKIIKIDQDLCNGCGICVKACHEQAIGLINGKAQLLRDDYCDGLGDCLPTCPVNAIGFEEREALAYDEVAVKQNQACKQSCPSAMPTLLHEKENSMKEPVNHQQSSNDTFIRSLKQWPVQIQLVPVQAAFFNNANLLIAADCSAYAYANFHQDFIKNHITIIGCPKLDKFEYREKIQAILTNNQIKSVKIVQMEVPCCRALSNSVIEALKNSEKMIPWQLITITTAGHILE